MNIVIDIDGVVGDILDENFVRDLIGDRIPDYSEKMLRRYNLHDIKERNLISYERLKKAFVDPEHIRTMPRYNGVEDALRSISACGKITFHTLILSDSCVPIRRRWIEALIRDAGIEADIRIDVGRKSSMPADILIEDNPDAFPLSTAGTKIMIVHPYNEGMDVADYKAASLLDAAAIIASL